MAYPTVDAPYGLKPIGLIGGQPYAGAVRHIPIADNYATSIYNGDVVMYKNDGTLIIGTADTDTSAVAGVIGVFTGCTYTDPNTGQQTFSNKYTQTNITTGSIEAYVIDDPSVLYKAVAVTNGTEDSSTGGLLPSASGISRANSISCNAELVTNAGVDLSGRSRQGVFINNVATILPITVVDVVEDTKVGADAYVEFIVKLTHTYQRYTHTAGV